MDAPSPPAPRRRFSLLLGPWHTSCRVVAVLVLVFLVFCNVPGQLVERIEPAGIWSVNDWSTRSRMEHGWPLTYLVRDSVLEAFTGRPVFSWCWQIWRGVREWRAGSLLANIAVCLLGSWALGAGFEVWRRGRTQVYQFHVRDVIGVITVVCAAGAWYGSVRRGKLAESAVLEGKSGIVLYETTKEGVTWVRGLAGDRVFEVRDRAVGIAVEPAALEKATALVQVERLRLAGSLPPESLPILSRFRALQALVLNGVEIRDNVSRVPGSDFSTEIRLPPLPRLQSLHIHHCNVRLLGLDQYHELESVRFSDAYVGEGMLRELSRLPKLKHVSIVSGYLESRGIVHLTSLPELSSLDLEHVSLGEYALRQIANCQGLRELRIDSCAMPDGGLRQLARLNELQFLELAGRRIDDQEVKPVFQLRNLGLLDINDTVVSPSIIPNLAQMNKLRLLFVPKDSYSEQDIERLEKELPHCHSMRGGFPVAQ